RLISVAGQRIQEAALTAVDDRTASEGLIVRPLSLFEISADLCGLTPRPALDEANRFGHIDMRAQVEVPSARRSDTPTRFWRRPAQRYRSRVDCSESGDWI